MQWHCGLLKVKEYTDKYLQNQSAISEC